MFFKIADPSQALKISHLDFYDKVDKNTMAPL